MSAVYAPTLESLLALVPTMMAPIITILPCNQTFQSQGTYISDYFIFLNIKDMSKENELATVEYPDENIIDYIVAHSKHIDRFYIAASIIAFRHDDPKVSADIAALLKGKYNQKS